MNRFLAYVFLRFHDLELLYFNTDKMVKCTDCLREFKSLTGFKRHRLIKRKCRVKELVCLNCQRKFSNPKSLLTHEKMYCRKRSVVIENIDEVVKEWLSPYIDINSSSVNWKQQCDIYLQKELTDGLLSWVDYGKSRHMLAQYCNLHSILEHYDSRKKEDLFKILITLFQQNKIEESAFLNIIMQL